MPASPGLHSQKLIQIIFSLYISTFHTTDSAVHSKILNFTCLCKQNETWNSFSLFNLTLSWTVDKDCKGNRVMNLVFFPYNQTNDRLKPSEKLYKTSDFSSRLFYDLFFFKLWPTWKANFDIAEEIFQKLEFTLEIELCCSKIFWQSAQKNTTKNGFWSRVWNPTIRSFGK